MGRALRILVLSVPIGAGHHRAAEGLCEAIRLRRPGTQWEILDALRYLGPDGGELAKQLYFGVLEEVPDLWGALYEQRGLSGALRPAGELVDELRVRALVPEVDRFAPDVILAMHPFAVGLASALRRTGRARCPVVAVLTDFDAHPAWIGRGVDLYLAATFRMVESLEALGLPTGSAIASGIPLRPAFATVRETKNAKEQLGLDPSRFTILLLGGGLGLGPIGEVARTLAQSDLRGSSEAELAPRPTDARPLSPRRGERQGEGRVTCEIQLVLIAGKNRELETSARAWAKDARVPVVVTGLVENVWDYVSAADVAIGKPGGLTCAELLAGGVPLIALDPIPGQEQANCEALAAEGAAFLARDVAAARDAVTRLLRSPEERDRMRAAASRLGRPRAAELGASHVLALLDEWKPEPARVAAARPKNVVDRVTRDVGREIGSGVDAIEDELRRLRKKLGM
ncbi:MAG: glycosyltransferase [Deltaproteobacteria bacterium]|nr:glycosyltransferase [Deltaproteobacteria bacterium]